MTDDTVPANVCVWNAIHLNALLETYSKPYTEAQLQELHTRHYVIMATVFSHTGEEIFEASYREAEERAKELQAMEKTERQKNIMAMIAYIAAVSNDTNNLKDFATLSLTLFHYFDPIIGDSFFEPANETEIYDITEKEARLTQFFVLIGAELILESNEPTERELLDEFRYLYQYFSYQVQELSSDYHNEDILSKYNQLFSKIESRQAWTIVIIATLGKITKQFENPGLAGYQADALIMALLKNRIYLG